MYLFFFYLFTAEIPKIITGLTDEHCAHHGTVHVMVRADGLPKPDITWYHNGKEIQQNETHEIVTKKETQVTSSLTISDYNENEDGIVRTTSFLQDV